MVIGCFSDGEYVVARRVLFLAEKVTVFMRVFVFILCESFVINDSF